MTRFLLLTLKALAALAFVNVACEDTDPPVAPVPRLDIGDGSKVTAIGVLRAVHSLVIRHDVTIYFNQGDQAQRSIVAMSQEKVKDLPIDWMVIRVTEQSFEMNDDVLKLEVLREKLKEYGDTARLVESTPLIVIAADQEASGQRLVTVLHELIEAGFTTIVTAL